MRYEIKIFLSLKSSHLSQEIRGPRYVYRRINLSLLTTGKVFGWPLCIFECKWVGQHSFHTYPISLVPWLRMES